MKSTLAAAALAIPVAFPAAAQTVLGEWNCDVERPPGELVSFYVDYAESGRFRMGATINNWLDGREFAVEYTAQGRWTLKGNRLGRVYDTVTVDRMWLEGKPANDAPATAHARAEIEALAGRQAKPLTLQFKGEDQFETRTEWGRTHCARPVMVIE